MTRAWNSFLHNLTLEKDIKKTVMRAIEKTDEITVVESSIQTKGDSIFFIAQINFEKFLVIIGTDSVLDIFNGEIIAKDDKKIKICLCNKENSKQIRTLFPYTMPRSRGDRSFSFGMGDRLGVATPGHINSIKGLDVFPVLAQQSMRELNLTGRTYEDVLNDVSWAVFETQYKSGYGADGDHLKTKAEIENALSFDYSMITLDCSDYLTDAYQDLNQEGLTKEYKALPANKREYWEEKYIKTHTINKNTTITFNLTELMKIVLTYRDALTYVVKIYQEVILPAGRPIDFEVSIDETSIPTSPQAHFFVASELKRQNIKIMSLAPRFVGEFQKGIDYLGSVDDFEATFKIHAQIAKYFDYCISVHSGSDKFSIFDIVGRHTKRYAHIKTSGTSWLEAVRLIATDNPDLYRNMHQFALENFEEAKKYYNIKALPENIAAISELSDDQLPELMNDDDARQLMHITYGLILQTKTADGKAKFKSDIYADINQNADLYCQYLTDHMSKHFNALGVE